MPPALGLSTIISGRTGTLIKITWHFPLDDAVFSSSDRCQISTILFGSVCANYVSAKISLTVSRKRFSKKYYTLFWTCQKFLANFSLNWASGLCAGCWICVTALSFAFLKSSYCRHECTQQKSIVEENRAGVPCFTHFDLSKWAHAFFATNYSSLLQRYNYQLCRSSSTDSFCTCVLHRNHLFPHKTPMKKGAAPPLYRWRSTDVLNQKYAASRSG